VVRHREERSDLLWKSILPKWTIKIINMSRKNIIDTAASQNGTKENPPNSNRTKYGEWYGMNGVSWCAIFVSWVYNEAGHPLGTIDSPKGYHYCPSAYNFWKRNNRITKDPQPGDIVLYDWNGDGLSDHTGIFIEWVKPGETFRAWEGNTSVTNDSDGGQVMLRTRSARLVQAFVNPGVFGDVIPPLTGVLKKGDKGTQVTAIQKQLYDLKYEGITVDGDFGATTEKLVKQFQQEHGLAVTGVVDAIVEGALQAELNKPKVADTKLTTGIYLRKGNTGSAVVALQKALNKKGVNPAITADGVFGNETVVALKAYQTDNGITADGVAGPETFNALGLRN
jgi:peptidoglycan hydrolase-like protein with peptidoglycan-binding domain